MNRQEFSKFALAMRTYYPKENLIPNEQAADLWLYQLKDIPYKVAEAMLCQWVATNKWSPTIADIREKCANIVDGEVQDWGDGWQQVIDGIRFYGYYREVEALATMSKITQKTVKRLGWQNLCMSENVPADRANFRNIFETYQKREREERQLPNITIERLKELRNYDAKRIDKKQDDV